mmetsp:Transcript_16767/g.46970  ORF Transcript_16767/g.46970 Transcript_16767/m.46970 type:complete len:242 (-) Transcript_16767:615-1340(-)
MVVPTYNVPHVFLRVMLGRTAFDSSFLAVSAIRTDFLFSVGYGDCSRSDSGSESESSNSNSRGNGRGLSPFPNEADDGFLGCRSMLGSLSVSLSSSSNSSSIGRSRLFLLSFPPDMKAGVLAPDDGAVDVDVDGAVLPPGFAPSLDRTVLDSLRSTARMSSSSTSTISCEILASCLSACVSSHVNPNPEMLDSFIRPPMLLKALPCDLEERWDRADPIGRLPRLSSLRSLPSSKPSSSSSS